jgi:hypothetical protein
VKLVAATLEDAYQRQRQQIVGPSAETNLNLADWCLQQCLFAQAELELADARKLEPSNRRLMSLERQLALLKARPPKTSDAARVAVEPTAAATVLSQSPTAISELPAGALELFTRRVQPVLVNNCTASGCHQAGGEHAFQLDRAILRGLSNRRSTMSNLAATLKLVDKEQPQLSPVLTVPRQRHGGMTEPVFGPRQDAAFRHVYDWVFLVAGTSAKPSPAAPAEVEKDTLVDEAAEGQDAFPLARPGPAKSQGRDVMQAAYLAAEDETRSNSVQQVTGTSIVGAPIPPRHGVQLRRWQPRDAFDPEIFNRQYAPTPEPTRQVESNEVSAQTTTATAEAVDPAAEKQAGP